MAPTSITRNDQIHQVLGSPSGSRIIIVVLQTAIDMIDYGMQPQAAVDAPRIHHH